MCVCVCVRTVVGASRGMEWRPSLGMDFGGRECSFVAVEEPCARAGGAAAAAAAVNFS